ncbi:MAG: GDYXXLXY domain-containing protein [Nitrospirae bacterium]|nr:GDYXXLXY domain-containing protein [Nitrospirota bacterium]
MRMRFAAIVLLQILLLTAIVAYKQWWIGTGTRVILKTEAIDPRSLFRGDYVVLNYAISTINLESLSTKETYGVGEPVYVSIQMGSDNTYNTVTAVNKNLPDNGFFIQGRVRSHYPNTRYELTVRDDSGSIHNLRPTWFETNKEGGRFTFCLDVNGRVLYYNRLEDKLPPAKCYETSITGTVEAIKMTTFDQLTVTYGIESYFVQEGAGKDIESVRNKGKLSVEVSLKGDGKAIITALLVDGKRVK